jgi:DNA-directed RNA polymerase subunit RPC12/RpoP
VADDFCQLTKQFEIAKCKDKRTNVMENQIFKCVKCGGEMKRGFLADAAHSSRTYFPSYFVEGEPINRETFVGASADLETEGRNMYLLRSLRCEKCGFAELYAV